MEIYSDELREFSRTLLSLLDREGIISTEDLVKKPLATFFLNTDIRDYVEFFIRPSNLGTTAHTVSYIRMGRGIPIELRVNKELGYSQIIVKAHELVEGYTIFSLDVYGNFAQNKLIPSIDFSLVIWELEKLSRLHNKSISRYP